MARGQFMMISSVAVAFIVISAASTIDTVQSQTYSNKGAAYKLEMIEKEAGKVDTSSPKQRDNFRKMVATLESYSTTTEYWSAKDCFNVTLRKTGQELDLQCIG